MAIKNNNLDLAVDILFNLPYLTLRKFIIYLLNERNSELEKPKCKKEFVIKQHKKLFFLNILYYNIDRE